MNSLASRRTLSPLFKRIVLIGTLAAFLKVSPANAGMLSGCLHGWAEMRQQARGSLVASYASWMERLVEVLSNNDYQKRPVSFVDEAGAEIDFQPVEFLGNGFFGVAYRARILRANEQAHQRYPQLFTDEGRPRDDLMIKFPHKLRFESLRKRWASVLVQENHDTESILAAVPAGTIPAARILLSREHGLPFLVKELAPGTPLPRLGATQADLMPSQMRALRKIWDIADGLFRVKGIDLDIKSGNLIWDPVRERFVLCEVSQVPKKHHGVFVKGGFDGYLDYVRKSMRPFQGSRGVPEPGVPSSF